MAEKPEDVKLDSIVDSLLIFLPLFYRKIFQVAHAKAGVNPGNMQFHVLAMIMRLGTLQTSEISRRLGISKPNTTSLLDKLIEKGYVQRILDSSDKRIKKISHNRKGKAFHYRQEKDHAKRDQKKLVYPGYE